MRGEMVIVMDVEDMMKILNRLTGLMIITETVVISVTQIQRAGSINQAGRMGTNMKKCYVKKEDLWIRKK
jgi:hypothetical protein